MTTPDPTDICETILRNEIAYNIEHDCLKSESSIARRLLARRLELVSTYAELHKKLGHDDRALRVFLGLILSTGAFWNREANAKARAGRKRLKEVNAEIADAAASLAHLLAERDALHNHSGFHSETHYHALKVVEQAAADNHLFNVWVNQLLSALRGQFGFKYWPSLSEFMTVLARDAKGAKVVASDEITDAATRASKKGLADVVKAIFAAIEERRAGLPILLPLNFRLTDASLASLLNCMLGLDADEIVGADFVKGVRQRERARDAAA